MRSSSLYSAIAAVGCSGALATPVLNGANPILESRVQLDPSDFEIASFSEGSLPEVEHVLLDPGNLTLMNDTGPAVNHEGIHARDIIGNDDRHLFTSQDWPFRSVGKLIGYLPNNWINRCSAALVGPRHVLTARHCVVEENYSGFRFMPNYDQGERRGGAAASVVITIPGPKVPRNNCEWRDDWAIIILDQRLGDQVGWFGNIGNPNPQYYDKDILYTLGYPGDRDNTERPYRQTNITPKSNNPWYCEPTGPFATNADAIGGQSGSPTWELNGAGERWVWGVLSGGGPAGAIHASGAAMIGAIVDARRNYP